MVLPDYPEIFLIPLSPWSLLSGHIGLALSEICQTLSSLLGLQKKETKTTIPLHYDVTPLLHFT